MIDKAITFATVAHRGQRRKYDDLPYIVHPIEVLEILVETVPDADEAMKVTAILHDTVEDTDVTIEEIERLFGSDVAGLTFDLTEKYTSDAYPNLNRAARKRLEAKRLGTVDPRAQTIKAADLISNTRSIVRHDPGFAKVYLPEKREVLDQMTEVHPDMRLRAQRSLTKSFARLNLHELISEPNQ